MASPGNQPCANCMYRRTFVPYNLAVDCRKVHFVNGVEMASSQWRSNGVGRWALKGPRRGPRVQRPPSSRQKSQNYLPLQCMKLLIDLQVLD